MLDDDIILDNPPLSKLVVVMVGLPARGKTYTARKIVRYFTWLGHRSRIFNVGNYRRKVHGADQKAGFFDPRNTEFALQRAEVAQLALTDMIDWLSEHGDEEAAGAGTKSAGDIFGKSPSGPYFGKPLPMSRSLSRRPTTTTQGAGIAGPSSIAIYDATNSTIERRQTIWEQCGRAGVKVFFVENICDDEEIIRKNILEVKVSSPDYSAWESTADIIADFEERIHYYAQSYKTLEDTECEGKISFVKIRNIGKQITLNLVKGYLESRIVYFLMNLNTTTKSFIISRHGESMYNTEGKIGGNSDLSPQGRAFAEKLPDALHEFTGNEASQFNIWTSTLKRTIQTSQHLQFNKLHWKQLDELSSGSCDGLTYEEIEQRFPQDYAERDDDKFNYRYHGGESYRDLVHRLEPVILELERHSDEDTSIYVIAHQAVVRAIYAYFHGISHDDLPYIKIPLHTLIKLTPKAYKCHEERLAVNVPAVDTFRPKPKGEGMGLTGGMREEPSI